MCLWLAPDSMLNHIRSATSHAPIRAVHAEARSDPEHEPATLRAHTVHARHSSATLRPTPGRRAGVHHIRMPGANLFCTKFERTPHIQHARTDAHTANIDAHSQGASSPRTHVHAPGTPDTPSAAPMSDPTSGSFSSMIATISGGRNFNTEFMSVCPRMPARTEEQRHNMNTRNEHNTRGTYDA